MKIKSESLKEELSFIELHKLPWLDCWWKCKHYHGVSLHFHFYEHARMRSCKGERAKLRRCDGMSKDAMFLSLCLSYTLNSNIEISINEIAHANYFLPTPPPPQKKILIRVNVCSIHRFSNNLDPYVTSIGKGRHFRHFHMS